MGLETFIQSFPLRWATFVPENVDSEEISPDGTTLKRLVNGKVLSDVVEATLGAAVLTGGTPTALETGEKLGLCFGGTTTWRDRPSARKILEVESVPPSPALRFLEDALGYKIRSQGRLLVQSLTHRSFPGDGYCYEREEYLGDAVLDWWATLRLFHLPASTTPRLLTFRRSMLVSNPTLALLAIRKLGVHKSILHNSPELEGAIGKAVEYASKVDWKDVVTGDVTWLWSPPKVLGDVFEAIIATVFIDSDFDLDAVFGMLDKVYEDIMPFVENGEERKDPVTRLNGWGQIHACRQLQVTRVRSETTTFSAPVLYTSTVLFHSRQIAQQIVPSKTVSKQLAANDALLLLEGDEGKKCDCKDKKAQERREKLKAQVGEENLVEAVESDLVLEATEEAEAPPTSLKRKHEDDDGDNGEIRVLAENVGEETENFILPLRVREY